MQSDPMQSYQMQCNRLDCTGITSDTIQHIPSPSHFIPPFLSTQSHYPPSSSFQLQLQLELLFQSDISLALFNSIILNVSDYAILHYTILHYYILQPCYSPTTLYDTLHLTLFLSPSLPPTHYNSSTLVLSFSLYSSISSSFNILHRYFPVTFHYLVLYLYI